MTDLKPEDRDIEKVIADLTNLATLAGDETFPLGRLVTSAKRKKLSEDLFVALSLLADRARMEKALREAERELAFAVERMGRTGGGYERALVSVRQALGASQ